MIGGKPALAPCGHLGEVVIGTYVRCPICDPKVNIRDNTAVDRYLAEIELWRGYPGHARHCACHRCAQSRELEALQLRNREGTTMRTLLWRGEPRLKIGKLEYRFRFDMAWALRLIRLDGSVLHIAPYNPPIAVELLENSEMDTGTILRLWLGTP